MSILLLRDSLCLSRNLFRVDLRLHFLTSKQISYLTPLEQSAAKWLFTNTTFQTLEFMFSIIMFHTNFILIISYSTGQEWGLWERNSISWLLRKVPYNHSTPQHVQITKVLSMGFEISFSCHCFYFNMGPLIVSFWHLGTFHFES